ncbi:MAG: RnfABCDGE type electron transport complex subunit B [Eubacteriales bacterium]|nr:RnfABCDGE type electron transport complex subunit B [Eubacteriales bacterium]
MDFRLILIAVLVVSGVGLIIGVVLAVASSIMAVPTDEKVEALTEALPGANCGACGYSGCSGYAKALSAGEAPLGKCSPGGEECVKELSKILGVEAVSVEKKTALVHCMGSLDNTTDKMVYQGLDSCKAAMKLHGGVSSCSFGCLGLGDCMKVCPYGAISVCNSIAHIDPELCRGCSMCVSACPKHLISFVPLKDLAVVRCSNCQKGAEANKVCKSACIGCKKCEKVCESGAVKVENFLASVDSSKCTGCMKCVDACPKGAITAFSVK